MTKLVHTSQMVAHLFAAGTQAEARNGNNTFSFAGNLVRSYSTVIAVRHAGNNGAHIVLVTNHNYSMTTQRHKSELHSAASHMPTFTVPDIGFRHFTISEPNHALNLAALLAGIPAELARIKRATLPHWQNAADLAESLRGRYVNPAARYAAAFGLDRPAAPVAALAAEALAFQAERLARFNTPEAAAKRERAKVARERLAERKAAAENRRGFRQAVARHVRILQRGAERHREAGAERWHPEGALSAAEYREWMHSAALFAGTLPQAVQRGLILPRGLLAFGMTAAARAGLAKVAEEIAAALPAIDAREEERKAAEAARWQAQLDAAEARRTAERAERQARALREWQAGEHVSGGVRLSDDAGGALIRFRGEGDGRELETSWGARVPLRHALRAFPLVAAVRLAGQGWQAGGRSIRLGAFRLDRIEPDGGVVAGCHRFSWQEIDRAARELGLDPDNAATESAVAEALAAEVAA